MKNLGCTTMVMLGLVWSCQAGAEGLPHFRVDDIVNSADLIVIADVNEIRELGPGQPVMFRDQYSQAYVYSAHLSVQRTLKGRAIDEVTVRYSIPLNSATYRGLMPGTRMVFLRHTGDRYDLADPYYSNFPATLEADDDARSDDITQLVLNNLLAVLASSAVSVADKREILLEDYALPSNEKTRAALRKALSVSADQEFSQRLMGELIRLGDLTQLAEAVNLLATDSANQNGRVSLLYAIRDGIKDARAIPELEPLLSSPDDALREAAAQALWHIASTDAIPALAQKLEDSDEMVRFYAVRGLADIANEDGWGGPTEGEFRDHEQKYLAHWRQWARKRASGEDKSNSSASFRSRSQ